MQLLVLVLVLAHAHVTPITSAKPLSIHQLCSSVFGTIHSQLPASPATGTQIIQNLCGPHSSRVFVFAAGNHGGNGSVSLESTQGKQ
jgi:hypothetical protein|mmetsp:Transcript_58572/g.97231  ORF Transcript_58572/g.97231 Transcript_58572/m.97231 type:complete len:87 (+) Transcript_58572:834-1094(+)